MDAERGYEKVQKVRPQSKHPSVALSLRSAGALVLSNMASEGALQQTVAAAARRTLVLAPEPVHHVTGVSAVTAAQAEVGGAAHRHVTDSALEGQALADSALSPSSRVATVTAEDAKLCRERENNGAISCSSKNPDLSSGDSQGFLQSFIRL